MHGGIATAHSINLLKKLPQLFQAPKRKMNRSAKLLRTFGTPPGNFSSLLEPRFA
jgi:hypothetical protein